MKVRTNHRLKLRMISESSLISIELLQSLSADGADLESSLVVLRADDFDDVA